MTTIKFGEESDRKCLKAATIAGEWWSKKLLQGDKEKFQDKLTEIVFEKLKNNNRHFLAINCDYDPDNTLLEALSFTGIDCRGYLFSCAGIFPEKHRLLITDEYVLPMPGYGQAGDKIFINEELEKDNND